MISNQKNRNGTIITYETINSTTIKMSGYGDYYRTSSFENGNTMMFDPSGGPYLEVGQQFSGGIINEIHINDNHVIIKLK